MWLAPPAIGLSYWLAWDRLPAQLATHFDAAGHANGWMTPEQSLRFGLVVTTIMAVVFTAVLTQIRRGETFSWAMLAFSYVLVGVLVYANESIISYNLHGNPVRPWPVLFAVGIASAALVVGILATKRGENLPPSNVLAEEVHASRVWGLVLAAPAAVAPLEPAALFESRDGGETWQPNKGLMNHEHQPKWQPGGGGLCLHTIVVDPQNKQLAEKVDHAKTKMSKGAPAKPNSMQ